MIAPVHERGGALLTVLLLVAVMATIAATALDRLRVGTRLAANVATVDQSRAWLGMAEELALTRIEDLVGADDSRTLGQGWLGIERTIALPGGGAATARITDGGNCFNLNSLVEARPDGSHGERAIARRQLVALATTLGIAEGQATGIAAAAADYIDSDTAPLASGREDGANGMRGMSSNQLMADPSELRVVPGVGSREFGLLRPWLCALPTTELSPLNINTLRPEQAPLLAMLAPGRLDVARARAQLSSRPADGFASVLDFWNAPALAGAEPDQQAAAQVRLKTSFFMLHARVDAGGLAVEEVALIDARRRPSRLVSRTYGSEV